MKRQTLTVFAMLPVLVTLASAGQVWRISSWQPYGIPSEDSGASSYLGVDIADVSSDRVATLKLKEERGVEVTMVDQDAPAGKAGLKEHDVILSMNGTNVDSKSQLQRMIHETPPGRTVTLGLSRDGQPMTIKLQLGDRRSEFHMSKMKDDDFHIEIPPIPAMPEMDIPSYSVVVVQSSARSGVMVENLTRQLGEFFGAKNGNGVLVRSVEKDSRADHAGLRAGDVIVRVGDQSIHDTSDFSHALHSRSSGNVEVEVLRDRKPVTLTLSLPSRKESGEMMYEESSEAPEIDADSRMELTEMQNEIARLQPQLELAERETIKASGEMRKSLCTQEKQMREQAQKLKQQYSTRVRDELRKTRDELRKQRDQIKREMSLQSSRWMDI
jgi:serine protease Do